MRKTPMATHLRYAKFLEAGLLALIALLPFSTFLTVWIASSGPDPLAVSAWKEILVVLLCVMGLYMAVSDRKLGRALLARSFNMVIFAYIALHLGYVLFADDKLIAFAGLATNVRFLLTFLLAQIVIYYRDSFANSLKRLVMALGALVAAIGGLQVSLLPRDLLTHVGYELPGIAKDGVPPAYHLVAGTDLMRAQATLRGPNVLGAYLILPMTLWFARGRILLATGIGLVLLLTHSRSAWLAGAVAIGLYVGSRLRHRLGRRHIIAIIAVAVAMVFMGGMIAMTTFGQRVLLHDTGNSTVEDSNQGHWRAVGDGLQDVASDPLGRGVGTAGPVSVLSEETRIAENYFIQIGQEIGWLGLSLLIALHVVVSLALWHQRSLVLLATLAGITVTNMLLHTWADETVAITWWTLAGAYLARK